MPTATTPKQPQPRWRNLAIALGAALLIGLGYAWLVPKSRIITGVAAAGPDAAIFLTRFSDNDSTDWWVEMIGVQGRHRWSTKVSPLETSDVSGFTGVVALEDRIVVLGKDRRADDGTVLALSRADGALLWEATLPGSEFDSIGPMLIPDGERVYVVSMARENDEAILQIDALAASDGAPLWRSRALGQPIHMQVRLVAPGRILVSKRVSGDAFMLDGATGERVASLPEMGIACDTREGAIGAINGQPILVRHDGEVWQAKLENGWRFGWQGPCGIWNGALVFGAERDGELALFAVDLATGQTRWKKPSRLQPLSFMGEDIVDGRLPRFLPVDTFGSESRDGNEVIVVDLESGETVERFSYDLGTATAVMVPERSHIWFGFERVLVELDPTTGRMARATRFEDVDFAQHFRPDDMRFGTLWMHSRGLARPATGLAIWPSSGLPFIAYDLRKAEVLHVQGDMTVQDVTDTWRAN